MRIVWILGPKGLKDSQLTFRALACQIDSLRHSLAASLETTLTPVGLSPF